MSGLEERPAPGKLDQRAAEHVAWVLGAPGRDVAFLRAAQGIYFAEPAAGPPTSPVLRLLDGIHALEPARARWIVRNRVFSTAPGSASCHGSIRVAGHTITASLPAADHAVSLEGLALIDAGRAAATPVACAAHLLEPLADIVAACPRTDVHEGWLALTVALAEAVARLGPATPHDRVDRPIAALLVGAGGALLGWATNTGARNSTRHAERNVVEAWTRAAGAPLPAGVRLYSSLKPCAMCAGVLWDSAAVPLALEAYFAQDDLGHPARETVLDPDSMARRRAVTGRVDRLRPLQWHVAPR